MAGALGMSDAPLSVLQHLVACDLTVVPTLCATSLSPLHPHRTLASLCAAQNITILVRM